MTVPKFASAERQAALLHAGARAAKSITTILDPEEIYRQTVDIICDEFGFYYAGIFLLDETGTMAVLKAGRGEAGLAMLAEDHKLKVGGNSMIGAAIAFHQARIALDVGEEAVRFQNPHLPETRSEMALPLIVGDSVLGAVTVQSDEEAAFTPADIVVLQTMADQLAIAINNARLHRQNQDLLREAERRARLLKAAAEVGRGVTSILNLDELLPKTVDIICDAYGFYYAGVFLLDELGEYAIFKAGYGEAGAAMLAKGHKLKVGGNSMIGMSIALREARISLDVEGETAFYSNPLLPHTRSEMALPLCVGEKSIGAVTVQSIEASAFNDEDIATLQTMADHLAIAINNAQTLKELERTHAELLRAKTYEALSGATTEAIHWIGNKALPISTTVSRMKADLEAGEVDVPSLLEDIELIGESSALIVDVKTNLIGAARENEPRPLMLAEVWKTAAQQQGMALGDIEINVAPGTPLALGDSTQLSRAFGNLLQNALEADAENLTVEVALAEEKGFVRTSLIDDGKGIPPEVQERIWTTFFTTKGVEHHGLGLAACLHVISQLDGRIEVESQPGQGAKFTILLPVAENLASADLGAAPDNVLLVAEESEWSAFVSAAFSSAKKNVVRQLDAKGASEAGLIIVDEAVSVSVIEILDALKASGMAQKTILVSSALQVERTTQYMRVGLYDVRLKPFTTEALAALLPE